MSDLKQLIDDLGGVSTVARICELSPRAVYKWLATSSLPRTEFTGETDYADRLAAHSAGRFSAEHIRNLGRRQNAA